MVIFAENNVSKVDKMLGLIFLRQENNSKDSGSVFPFTLDSFSLDGMFTPFIPVDETVV